MQTTGKTKLTSDFSLIRRLYLCALFPNVIAVLGGTINVFFDGILVGQRIGDVGLEAVNQSLPAYLVLCAPGSLIASGASQLSAMAFGSDNIFEGRRIFRCSVTVGVLSSILLCLIALAASQPLALLLSSDATYDYLLPYLRITLICGIFKVLLYIPYFYLRLEGKNNYSMAMMLAMTVINIVLDYIFLFVLDMGIAGAAWASGIATAAACVMGFAFLCTRKGNFIFSFALPKLKDMANICRFGAMMALNNILSAVKIFAVNKILGYLSAVGMTAIFSVVNNISEFSICVQNGVPQASGAMTGILYAEQDTSTVKKLLVTQIISGVALSVLLTAVMCICAGDIGSWFGSSEDVSIAVYFFASSLVPATLNNIMCYYYNATGNVGFANLITVCRGCVVVVLFCYAFSGFGQGVWAFFPAAEGVTLIIFLAAGAVFGKLKKRKFFFLLDESMQKSGRSLCFSAEYNPEEISGASIRLQDFCDENGLSPKVSMAVSLSVEEMLTVLAEGASVREKKADVRVVISDENVILRVRSGGKRFNPMALVNDEKYIGMRLIAGLAKKTEYQSALGVNTFVIFI